MGACVGRRWSGRGAALALLVSACAASPSGAGAPALDDAALAHLVPCGDAPYVAVFGGVTQEGLEIEKYGSVPSGDVYGIRPDGTAARITTDLGTYNFGVSTDGWTVYASPYPTYQNTDDFDPATGPGPSFSTSDQVVRIDLRTGEREALFEAPSVLEVIPAPDGSQLAVTTPVEFTSTYAPFRPGLLDLAKGSKAGGLRRLPGFDPTARETVNFLAWSPDGRRLAYLAILADANTTNEVRVVDVATGAERVVHSVSGRDGWLTGLDWSADGRRLLTVENKIATEAGEPSGRLLELDVESGSPEVVLDRIRGKFRYSARDGSTIMSLDSESGVPLAQTWTRGSDGVFTLTAAVQIGRDMGLVAGGELDIADCALA